METSFCRFLQDTFFAQVIVGCKGLQHHILSLFYLWVSTDTRGKKKREFCRLLRKEVSSKYNVRRYDRVLTTNELKCNKRADSNAIIGRRKLGKSKKLLRFTQAHLHKFIQLIKVYPLNYVIIYQFLAKTQGSAAKRWLLPSVQFISIWGSINISIIRF